MKRLSVIVCALALLVGGPVAAQDDPAGGAAFVRGPIIAKKLDLKTRLQRMAVRGSREYRSDIDWPVGGSLLAPWQASTAVSTVRSFGNIVAYTIKTGTTGSTQPVPNAYTTDGTAIWQRIGTLLPVDFTVRSQNLVLGQTGYAGGETFRVTVAGTSASSGTGPTIGSLTDGTVTFEHVGPQLAPLVTYSGTAPSGLSLVLNGDGSTRSAGSGFGATLVGGQYAQNGTNNFGKIAATSFDGNAIIYSNSTGASGGEAVNFTGTKACYQAFSNNDNVVWSDGQLVAVLLQTNTSSNTYVCLDYTNMVGGLYRPHVIREDQNVGYQFAGWYGAGSDTFTPYKLFDNLRCIFTTDSFGQNPGGPAMLMSWPNIVGRLMGCDDTNLDTQGGTGILTVNGTSVSYTGRYNVGVLNRIGANGTVHIIQGSQNDTGGAGIGGGQFTNAQLMAALDTMVASDIAHGIYPVIVSIWGSVGRADQAGAAATQALADEKTIAAKYNIPFIDQSALVTAGGYAGSANFASGNSGVMTFSDQTHPTQFGTFLRAQSIAQQIIYSISGLPITYGYDLPGTPERLAA